MKDRMLRTPGGLVGVHRTHYVVKRRPRSEKVLGLVEADNKREALRMAAERWRLDKYDLDVVRLEKSPDAEEACRMDDNCYVSIGDDRRNART